MRSLRTRLALLVFVIVAVAVGVVALGVLQSLDGALRDRQLRGLRETARQNSAAIDAAIDRGDTAGRINRLVRDAADQTTSRVTLLGVARTPGDVETFLKSDSTAEVEIRDLQFDVAVQAARTGRPAVGTEAGDAGRIGEAALPLRYRDPQTRRWVIGSVIVWSRPLDDIADTVAVVRNRLLAAAVIALVAAALAAMAVSRALSARVNRLQRVAARVAEGDLAARFPVDTRDEIGRLARTLEAMRLQLAELDDARKRFIATASHELRTPLFSLGGFLELLEEEDLDEADRRRFVTQLREQVLRMQKLATDLLDLSRLEAGSLELRSEETDLGDIARRVAGEFAPALAAHGSHVELRLPRDAVRVDCDPERVAQVMRILIDNAITHTPAGTDLVVSASRRADHARLGVGDFGPGIHRTMLPRIFEPFVTTDDAQGSGLGLAIARELAERMNGSLAVQSQAGRTTFTLELPA
ncbi:HAMP domain-containing histidine kinase [Baekduia soli]|uniref:histidine kinase n=1 Tax=Baekduia soli TaxID=496014 RepID=A0A5B8U1N0_9ACTN|nr:HAMP domain-containing sensor histidine kinase [Baekduia soli]QEC46725.1 HAMP domain-containing histidine kinase [Baekduia soli]